MGHRSVAPGITLGLIFGIQAVSVNVAWPAAVDVEKAAITIAMTQEPPNLNSMRMTDLVSFFVIGHINEGLLRYDRQGRLAPGVAESWQVQGSKLVFSLRPDAKWQDGSPVTAHDFVYAWRRVVDPAEAAPFASIIYPLKNAEKIQRGQLPVTALGVRAEGERRLVVEWERPCGYCLSLVSHGTFFPVKASFHQAAGARFGSEASLLLANGPFRLTHWTHDAEMTFEKNDHYWDRDNIHLDKIRVGYITADNRTRLNLFRDKRIALVRLDAETLGDAIGEGLRPRTFSSGGIAYLWFNHREGRATSHLALRRAIQAIFDADIYVNQVIAIPGYRATRSFFPGWLRGSAGRFRTLHPVPEVQTGQKVADAYMKALEEAGVTVPPLRLLTVASPTGARVAEYLQGLLKQSLGLDLLVDRQTFKQYLDRSRRGDFDMAFASWYPDFDDLVTYADLLGSYNPNNRGAYRSRAYDHWLEKLVTRAIESERFAAGAALQRLIVQEVPVLPMAETGSAYLLHPKLKGVVRRVIGPDPDYTYAEVVE